MTETLVLETAKAPPPDEAPGTNHREKEPNHMSIFETVQLATSVGVIDVTGDLDSLTAPVLSGALSALIDGGHTDLVVELAKVEFMGAAGFGVIASMSTRLGIAGGTLSIRSPQAQVRRVLEIVAMGALVELSLPAALAAEQRADDRSAGVTDVRAGSIDADLTGLIGFPATAAVVDAALRLVTDLAHATLDGADGASVSLTRHGKLDTVAATDETILQMDRDQYATGQGPCVSAATEGHWFHVESLDKETRWPQFVPRAIEGGIGSILSTPLMCSAHPVGALNIYSVTERAFGQRDQELAAKFASEASAMLAQSQVDVASEQFAARLKGALQVREIIAQAQGVVMARRGVPAELAAAEIRQTSKALGISIRQRSNEVLASTRRGGLIGEDSP